jgi:hypothetical protein
VSAGELVALRDIEKLLGKALPRELKPEFDYAVSPNAPKRPVARVNRTGGRYGSRNVDELTPEELQKLLGVS